MATPIRLPTIWTERTYDGVSYIYINDERLKSASNGVTTYSMTYDALGRCMKRTLSNGPTTYYVYDGDKPVLEYDGSGTSVGTNVYGKGVDEILERVAAGVVYYPQQDHEGSVMLLTDSGGGAIERYRYDAFGAPTFYTGTWGARSNTIYDNRFLFSGREYAATYRSTTNAAFNFYEYRARAYNPKLGRFMSEDPKIFDAGDYNLFRYCHNDPIDFTDPMGLETNWDGNGPQNNHNMTAMEAVWQRQMKFSSSYGAINEALSHMLSNVQRIWANRGKNLTPVDEHTKTVQLTMFAAAPVEEAPAALAGLGRFISRMFRASEEGTTSTALSTIRFTHSGETFYRYESGSSAFSRVTSSGGVTPETFAAPTSDGLVPIHLRVSTYKLPTPNIPRPNVINLRPSPGTAVIGPRSVVGGPGNEVMFPFGY